MSGIYLHIPFCEHKCVYCDFYSIEHLSGIDGFLKSLEYEIELASLEGHDEVVETVYVGGGTPSLLSPTQLERIISLLDKNFRITKGAEITVESNPGTVDEEKLAAYRSIGVNRLSIGIQSFDDAELRFLTRIHSSDQAKQCVRAAHRVGFDNVSVDLIFALPGQTPDKWLRNLRSAADLDPQHISAYSLIVERGTPLSRMVDRKLVTPLPADEDAELYERTMKVLAAEGFEHYEVSNYAKPGFRSLHNSCYWHHVNYLGFGPSAHSFWQRGELAARRWWNVANVRSYHEMIGQGRLPIIDRETIGEAELLEETVMLGLRSDGLDLAGMSGRFGIDLLRDAAGLVRDLGEQNLAVLREGRLRLTDQGYLVCDEIVRRMLGHLDRAVAAA